MKVLHKNTPKEGRQVINEPKQAPKSRMSQPTSRLHHGRLFFTWELITNGPSLNHSWASLS